MPHEQMSVIPWRSNPRISASEDAAPPTMHSHRPGKFPSPGKFLERIEDAEPDRRHAESSPSRAPAPSDRGGPRASANGPGSTTFAPAIAAVNGNAPPIRVKQRRDRQDRVAHRNGEGIDAATTHANEAPGRGASRRRPSSAPSCRRCSTSPPLRFRRAADR